MIEPCPFCGNIPYFDGIAEWKDDHRYVQLSLICCVTMTDSIGWQRARNMTAEERTSELKNKLIALWNTRA